jgi:uncharacterized damage-inducible protein DinB
MAYFYHGPQDKTNQPPLDIETLLLLKIMAMNKLQTRLSQLEADRKKLFDDLKKHSDTVLNQKPGPEAWSVAEVIAHIMTAEEYSLKYLQKKVTNMAESGNEGLKHKWRWLLVQAVFTFDIKFKSPDIVEPKIGFTSLADLDSRWSATRIETAKILNTLSDAEMNKTLWKHAVAGKMNLHHMVAFFGIHYNRHKKQIDRTLKAVQ